MHLSDTLLSPQVAGAGLAFAAISIAAASARLRRDEASDPAAMGVLGAFVFAAQMVNFSVPGTGSSGHLGGGLLLAALLGPQAALLMMASILALQALLFADGGLLAWGCNLFNLGFLPAYLVYPLVFKPVAGKGKAWPLRLASVLGGALAMLMGAAALVAEIGLSGRSDLSPRSFALLMLPIHLAIGLAEGIITAALLAWLWKARPEMAPRPAPFLWKPLLALGLAAALLAGLAPRMSSVHPDGLEWSLLRARGAAPEAPVQKGGGIGLALACVAGAGALGLLSSRRRSR